MNPLEHDLRYLGVLEKALEIAGDLGSEAACRYVRSSYHLLSKVYHPDLHKDRYQIAEQGQRRLNEIKEHLDSLTDSELARFLGNERQGVQKHHRILVVDDEASLRENLSDLLNLEGFHVQTAHNGIGGLGAQLTFRPDLVITDVVMPIMDGVTMIRQMRQRDSSLKAIFISGFFGSRSVRNELIDEINRFGYQKLTKPFRPSQLFTMVRQALL